MLNKILQLAILGSCLVNTALAIPYSGISQLYFLGDSLTDSGFNDYYQDTGDPSFPPQKAPTFTTQGGYTWAQYLANDIKGIALTSASQYPVTPPNRVMDLITNNTVYAGGYTPPGGPFPVVSGLLNGIDYACGGSTTNSTGNGIPWAPSILTQVNQLIANANGQLDPNALYFIWAGANDLLVLLPNSPSQLQLLQAANNAAINIATAVATLTSHGAKRVVVLSLPNIGYTPLIVDQNNPALEASLKTVTFTFNSMLNQQLGGVIANYGTKILYIDVYDLLDNVILAAQAGTPYVVNGQSFIFTNYTQPACGFNSSGYVSAIDCATGSNGYVFADDVHPTDMAHRLLSLAVEQAILGWA